MPIKPGNPDTGPAPSAQGELPKAPATDTPAVAAQPPEPAATQPSESAAAQPSESAAATDVIAAQADDQALVSEVVGAKAVTPSGDDLGKVKDLIVGRDGKVEGAVLSVGGFLGIGDKQVALPWSALKQGGPDQPLVVAMTKDQLEAAPEFKTLADQRAEQQAALTPPPAAVPAPATGTQ